MNHDQSPRHIPARAKTLAAAFPALLLVLALSLPAWAQEGDDGPFLSTEFSFTGSAEFDDHTGEVSANTLSVSGGFEWLSLSYTRTDYSWSDNEHLPFGNGADDPWDTLHSVSLASEHDGMFNHEWGWFAGLEVEAAFETELSGSFGVQGYGGGVYMINDSTSISFGLAASAHETGLEFLPLIMVGWDAVDQTGAGWFASLGIPQTMVGYSFSSAFSLTLELGMEGGTYRLADDSTVAPEGYVGTGGMDLSLCAQWSPLENVTLSLGPSYRFGRSMTIYDDSGDKIKSHDLDNAAGGFVDISIAF